MFSPVFAASSVRSSSIVLPSCLSVVDVRLVEQRRPPRATSRAGPRRSSRLTSSGLPSSRAFSRRPRSSASLGLLGDRPRPRRTAGVGAPRCAARPRGRTPGSPRCGPRSRSRSGPRPARRPCRRRGCRRRRRPRWCRARRAWRPRPGPSRAGSRSPCRCRPGLLQRGLAVHHPGAGALAQRLHVLWRRWRCSPQPSSSGSKVRRSRGARGACCGAPDAVPLGVAGSSRREAGLLGLAACALLGLAAAPAPRPRARAFSSASRRSCLLALARGAASSSARKLRRRGSARHVGDAPR